MMPDDGSCYAYHPDFDNSNMEIIIETLTGTTFEMTVSPTDTIMSIKNKIQRVEGIPVSQQHLLHRLKELNNDEKLCDHGVKAGSTLRLVLSMRGGPISTRRLAASDHQLAWKELKEYVDNTREDVIDKLPPGSKVTVFLFRDGENINLIRVIENEDGTCYPYSDSWSPHNNITKESSHGKSMERSNENNTMMYKVLELRRKMEGLSLQRKAKKPVKNVLNKEECGSSIHSHTTTQNNNLECNVMSSSKNGDNLRVGKHLSEMYSDRLLLLEHRRNARTNIGRSHRTHRVDSTFSEKPNEVSIPTRNCNSISSPSITILEEESESSINKKETDFSPPSPISVTSGDANTIAMSQMSSLPGTSRNIIHLAHVPHVVLPDRSERPNTSPENFDPKAREFCNVLFSDVAERSHKSKFSISNRRKSFDFSENKPNKIQHDNSSPLKLDNTEEIYKSENPTEFQGTYSKTLYNSSNLLTSNYASTSRLNSNDFDNTPGSRILETSTKYNNERSPLYGRRARIERTRNTITEHRPDRYGYTNLDCITSIKKIQNDGGSINRQISSQYSRRHLNFVSNLESRNSCEPATYELRPCKLSRRRNEMKSDLKNISEDKKVSSLEPLPILVPKKPTRTRCLFCNKRLNITTIHTCPCGGIFCSQHRYSEVHGCHYDYKTEGRKFLEQANPLVAAPKLPKI